MENQRIRLRPITEEDTLTMIQWRNNPLILKTVFDSKPITREQHLNWLKNLRDNPKRIEFVIEIIETHEAIGRIGLDVIDHLNQKAEYSISIGEISAWGKGYGSEATNQILTFGFEQLNLQKIYLKVFKDNLPAVRLYERMGFTVEGVLKDDVFKDGEFKTVLFMSIFRKDFHQQITS